MVHGIISITRAGEIYFECYWAQQYIVMLIVVVNVYLYGRTLINETAEFDYWFNFKTRQIILIKLQLNYIENMSDENSDCTTY